MQRHPRFPHAFYPHVEFLVEPGGAVLRPTSHAMSCAKEASAVSGTWSRTSSPILLIETNIQTLQMEGCRKRHTGQDPPSQDRYDHPTLIKLICETTLGRETAQVGRDRRGRGICRTATKAYAAAILPTFILLFQVPRPCKVERPTAWRAKFSGVEPTPSTDGRPFQSRRTTFR